jgi:hypothetical protein
MENLTAEIRKLQVCEETILKDIKAVRDCQKEMAAIKAGQEEMRAAVSHLRSAQAHSKVTCRQWVQRSLIPTERDIQNLREISRHETFITRPGNKQLMNTLSGATKHGLKIKLTEAEDRVNHEGSGNAAICVDRGRPLLPGSQRLGCLPCEGTPQKDFPEEDRLKPEKREVHMEKKELVTSRPPHNITPVSKEIHYSNLKAIGRIGHKRCIVTVDTGASVSTVRPDIAAGFPERQVLKKCYLRSISGQTLPILKEAYVELTLGKRLLIIWVFVANIREEFTLGLDVMCAHKAVVDLGRHVLRLDDEEVPLRRPPPTKDNSEAAEARRDTDAAVGLKRLLDNCK